MGGSLLQQCCGVKQVSVPEWEESTRLILLSRVLDKGLILEGLCDKVNEILLTDSGGDGDKNRLKIKTDLLWDV